MTQRRWRSLVDGLRRRADRQPDALAYTFLDAGEDEGQRLTWGALETRSLALGAAMAGRVARGGRVLVMFPPTLDFVPAFFGALCAGAMAVPTYPPGGGRIDRTVARLRGMITDAGVSLIVAPAALRDRAGALEALLPELRGIDWLASEDVPDDTAREWRDPGCRADDIALLQYTSGSTAAPRGVMVTHGNLLHNLAHSARLAGHDAGSVAISWLPVNHDMGLIDGILQPAYSGFPAYLMAPAAFLQRPVRWLQAISRYRATHSGGPNFAYDLCVRRIPEEDRRPLDLGSWRIAFNGSEPVRYATLAGFQQAFGACGFRWRACRPAYGLAESTLLVTSSGDGRDTAPLEVCGAALARGEVVEATDSHEWTRNDPPPHAPGGTVPLMPSGTLDGTSRVLIVDPSTHRQLDGGRIGEIWVAGPSVAAGYWRRPVETRATFEARLADTGEGPFLRTGDLGFVRGQRLFVSGRIKDVLIVRGLKHYPQDLELTAERAHAALRPGGCAAFALPRHDAEAVALVAEIDPRYEAAGDPSRSLAAGVVDAIRRSIAETHHLALAAVALVPTGRLPKTTSGKLQRYLCREACEAGTLEALHEWTDGAPLLEQAAS